MEPTRYTVVMLYQQGQQPELVKVEKTYGNLDSAFDYVAKIVHNGHTVIPMRRGIVRYVLAHQIKDLYVVEAEENRE